MTAAGPRAPWAAEGLEQLCPIVGYQSVTSETPVTFNVSLSGVTAGLAALGIP
jgi:hypothetical protein